MAKSIASLFGPSAEEIVYAQQEAGKQRQQQQLQNTLAAYQDPMARQFYQSGYNIASGAGGLLGGLFGDTPMADPRLGKNLKLRKILGSTGVEDLNDASKVSALSSSLGKAGLTQEALYFADRAKELKKYNLELNKLGTITPVKDFVLADGTPVGQDGYGRWSTLNGKPVSVSELVTEKTYLAGATAGTKDVTAGAESDIELTLLSDIDLNKEDKEALSRRIEQEADKILVKKGNKLTREQARKNAFENLKETGVLRKTDIGLYPLVKGAMGFDTDLPYFQDWQYVPEGTGTVLKPGFRIVAED